MFKRFKNCSETHRKPIKRDDYFFFFLIYSNLSHPNLLFFYKYTSVIKKIYSTTVYIKKNNQGLNKYTHIEM